MNAQKAAVSADVSPAMAMLQFISGFWISRCIYAIAKLSIPFFKSVPAGADAIALKWIIHDWNDEQCVTILKNCHRALPENGKLILVEAVVPAGNEPHFSKFIDLNMLIMTGGRERTEEEFRQLYETAGFSLTRIVPTESPFSVIEGVKV